MIINDNKTLTTYIPNVMAAVEGEDDLYTKIKPQIDQAEDWLVSIVLGEPGREIIEKAIEKEQSDDENVTLTGKEMKILDAARNVVATSAYLRALPKLDVILTPNGFGIVSNSNIAPASKERVQRLSEELEKERDDETARLVNHLRSFEEWRVSPQAEWFAATLFPSMFALCWAAGKDNSLKLYKSLRERLILIESDIAATHISFELYDALRKEELAESYATPKRKLVAGKLRAMEADRIRESPMATALLVDLVQYIRENVEDFPEWEASATAKLFEATRFENKKKSTAYFF